MEPIHMFLLLLPFILLVLAGTTVLVVALVRANRGDVPEVVKHAVSFFVSLCDRLPRVPRIWKDRQQLSEDTSSAPAPVDEEVL